ncbi:MAG: metal ABC transporter substrate-binding protein [Chloroflexota bacterium]
MKISTQLFKKAVLMIAAMTALVGCVSASPTADPFKIQVVVSSSILADVVSQVGGDLIQIEVLLPAGSDPHTFQPSPKDLSLMTNADVVMIIGLDLESFLTPLFENAANDITVIAVSDENKVLSTAGGENDPHVWMDPNKVMDWLAPISNALAEIDPDNEHIYQGNAAQYRAALIELDAWIKEQVASIPEANRLIVSDHNVFGYFANRYGMEVVGAIIPGYSTLAEPSARQLAALQDVIESRAVRAIFVSEASNTNLAQRIAEDTGVAIVSVYTGSLSAADGPAGSYVEMMRYNVNVMVSVLG